MSHPLAVIVRELDLFEIPEQMEGEHS